MAKATLPVNYVDDALNSAMDGKRRYKVINNADGTISLEDVTTYDQVGSNFGASQLNTIGKAINESADSGKIIDDIDAIRATTQEGYIAGALALKAVDNSLGKYELLCYATSTGNISVQDLTKYKAVLVLLQIDNTIYSNLLIPLSLFKTIASGRCNYYESNGVYKCDFKYVDDTTINVLSLSNSTRCYFYGI